MSGPGGLFNMTASVYAVTWAVGTDGSEYSTYGSAKTCPCALQPLSAREAQVHGRDTGIVLSRLYLPLAFDDGTAMTVNKGAKVSVDGTEYRTLTPLRNEGGRNVFYSADVEKWT